MKLDKDDQNILGAALVIATAATTAILSLAGVLGLAWRLFRLAAG